MTFGSVFERSRHSRQACPWLWCLKTL